MKKLILISCIFLYFYTSKAQNITGIVTGTTFNYLRISNTQHNFTFHTYFNLGYQTTCPTLINPTFSIVNDTLFVNVYYDITGAWPASFCNSLDTITYNNSLPSNITHIITSTNVIGYNNTPPYIPATLTYENVYTQDFNLTLSFNEFIFNKISLFPNPTNNNFTIPNNTIFDNFKIFNNLGQVLKSFTKNSQNDYNISDLKTGVYNIIFLDENNLKIGETKLLKI